MEIADYKDVNLKDCKRLWRQLFMALLNNPKNTFHYTKTKVSTIQDILALRDVHLLAPPIMTKNKISPKATTLTRRIA